jgi:AcrR family transcriptional regulator
MTVCTAPPPLETKCDAGEMTSGGIDQAGPAVPTAAPNTTAPAATNFAHRLMSASPSPLSHPLRVGENMSNSSVAAPLLAFSGRKMPSAARRLQPRLLPKQQRSAETRARILDAAAQVFAAHGYVKGTTNRIAEAAGVSVGSVCQYFPNKDAILVELARAHVREGEAIILERFADPDLPPDLGGRVRVFVEAAVANHVDMPRLHEVIFQEAPWPPELVAELRAFEERTIVAAEAALATDPSVRGPRPAASPPRSSSAPSRP